MKRIVTLLAVALTLALSGVVNAKITGTSISPAGELVILNCDRLVLLGLGHPASS